MPLTLVLGPANAAKAGEVLGAYQLAARRDALLVVPTSADASYYDRELAEGGHLFGRALTFPRLLEEVARRTGMTGRPLTPLQKERLLRRVIRTLTLASMQGSAAAPGFARAASRLIAELGQARVSAPRFAAALRDWAADRPTEQQYAAELAAVYLRYADELRRLDRLDAEGFGWEALECLRTHPDRWGRTAVYLYGFDDLTSVELDAVTTLSDSVGVPVTVSLTYEPGREALAARATVVEDLRAHATTVKTLPPLDTWYEPASRAALHHLERHLFEPGAPAFTGDPGWTVKLLEAGGARAEAELVAAEVVAALEAGVAPEELVVVCRTLKRSGALFERALERVGVAVTSARRIPLGHTSLGRALLALLRCAFEPTQATGEDLLMWLRAPGVLADPQALDAFEARVRQAGVTGLAETVELADRAGLPVAAPAELRRAPEPLAAVAGAIRWLLAAPHRGQAAVLDPAEALDARAAACALDALTELEALEQERRVGAEELIELLLAIEVNGPAGVTPGGAILIAEPLAIRARRFRRVVVTGLCEGEFPAAQAGPDPLLGEHRRHDLALTAGIALAADHDPLARERYLLYACVSRATEAVTFSYRSSDEDGDMVAPSPFLDDIVELFGEEWFGRRRRRLLGEDGEPSGQLSFAGADGGPEAEPARTLGTAALAHVRHTRVVSGGALEAFAACPVRWLIESQLNPEELDVEPEPLAKGSFMHEVLEGVISRLGGPLTKASLPLAEQILDELLQSPPATIAAGRGPEVRAAVLRGIEADLRRYLRHEAASSNGWTPRHAELQFGMRDEEGAVSAVTLGDGDEAVLLRGVIDRVDVEPGTRRAIIRDYKSGAKRPEWPVAHWLEADRIQVALYMLAVRQLLELEPVAGFYQSLSGADLRPRGVYTAGVDPGRGAYDNDAVSESELAELLEQIERRAVELAATLRRGELTPCPHTCTGSAGGGCRYPGLCWAVT